MATPTHKQETSDVVLIGGGLAGLTAAILLAGAGKKVLLLEKKTYPFHKVCGEYVSNEVLGFLRSIGFSPYDYGASRITKLRISTPRGKNIFPELGTGGFGLSRYTMDAELARIASEKGARLLTGTRVTDISFDGKTFLVRTGTGEEYPAKLVIGSYGKRDTLDKKLDREFMRRHSGYLAVKYHLRTDYPVDEIGLDVFAGGYSGIAKIEGDRYNLCYLYHRKKEDHFTSIAELEETVLFRNPFLRSIFANADRVFPEPEAINQISFASKSASQSHVLMCGDTAGLIAPLCGNGMSMAIHAAKLLSELLLESGMLEKEKIAIADREALERVYAKTWNRHFRQRLFWGKFLQTSFANPLLSELSLRGLNFFPGLERWIISNTHGKIVPAWGR